eukprot:9639882-Ditylum_brightwellii.AAC.1
MGLWAMVARSASWFILVKMVSAGIKQIDEDVWDRPRDLVCYCVPDCIQAIGLNFLDNLLDDCALN